MTSEKTFGQVWSPMSLSKGSSLTTEKKTKMPGLSVQQVPGTVGLLPGPASMRQPKQLRGGLGRGGACLSTCLLGDQPCISGNSHHSLAMDITKDASTGTWAHQESRHEDLRNGCPPCLPLVLTLICNTCCKSCQEAELGGAERSSVLAPETYRQHHSGG